MSKKLQVYALVLFFWFTLLPGLGKAEAAILFLDPGEDSVKTNEQFDVVLKIDTEGESSLASDAVVLFDSTSLELVDVVKPPEADRFFPEIYTNIKSNSVYIGAAVQPSDEPKKGKGQIAILTFKGITSNTNIVSFECEEGKTVDSNISIKDNSTIKDVISCSALEDARYAVSADGETTPPPGSPTPRDGTPDPSASPSASISPTKADGSPTPTESESTPSASLTPTGGVNPSSLTPTPSTLPDTGVIDMTLMTIGIGLMLAVISLGIKAVAS